MKKILGINPQKGSGICTISCISNVMTYYGDRTAEYEAYILVNGFQTSFYNGYVSINTLQYLSDQMGKNGKYQTTWLIKNDDILNTVISALNIDEPVIVLIDSSYLTFDERLIKEHDFLRAMLIYGIDSDKKVFYVYDTSHLDKDQQVEVISFEIPIQVIHGNAKELLVIHQVNHRNMPRNYRTLLIDNLKHYLNYQESKSLFGMNAVFYHFSYVKDILENGDRQNQLETCYYTTNTFIYGTFIPMCTYLIEALNIIVIVNENEVLTELKALKTKWIILSNKAMKLTVTKRTNQVGQFVENYKLNIQRMENLLGLLLDGLIKY